MSQYIDTSEISTNNSRADDLDIPFDLRRGACGKVFHPLAFKLFPAMAAQEFAELVESIRAGGLHDPIVTCDEMIIDGRHRALACEVAKVEPVYIAMPSGADPLQFVIAKNLHRRQLNESQRSMVAANIANMRQGERTDLEPSANLQKVDRATAAKLLNVSERSVAYATKVEATGAPELVRAADQGAVSVSAAAEIATLPVAEQRGLVAKGSNEIAKAARIIRTKNKKRKRAARITEPQRSKHDVDLDCLASAWEMACDSAREAFLERYDLRRFPALLSDTQATQQPAVGVGAVP
jgi:ParB-like chromosome segregation protein Spo0J